MGSQPASAASMISYSQSALCRLLPGGWMGGSDTSARLSSGRASKLTCCSEATSHLVLHRHKWSIDLAE